MGLNSVDQQPKPVDTQADDEGDLFQDILSKKNVRRRSRGLDLLGQLQKQGKSEESRTGFYIPSNFSQDEKELLLDAVLRLLTQVTRKSPLAIFFEDAHWLDTDSRELLSQIQTSLETLPLFILLAQREKIDRSKNEKIIKLNPLSDSGTSDLVANILISDLTQIIHGKLPIIRLNFLIIWIWTQIMMQLMIPEKVILPVVILYQQYLQILMVMVFSMIGI